MRTKKEGSLGMKNNYVKKLLCITLISAMIISSSFSTFASDIGSTSENVSMSEEITDEPVDDGGTQEIVTPAPEPSDDPTVVPTETPVPDPTETVTPEPVDPTETPAPKPTTIPGEDDIAGLPVDPGDDQPGGNSGGDLEFSSEAVIAAIDAIGTVTLDSENAIANARNAYEALSEDQKAQVTNYGTLVAAEEALSQLKNSGGEEPGEQPGEIPQDPGGNVENQVQEEPEVINGPITRISSGTHVVNLKAGRTFYLNQLKSNYSLSFSNDIEEVMDEIEEEFLEANKLDKEDEYLVHNWQDILAVYVLQQTREGKKSFKLGKSSKDDLAAIFAEMNELKRDKKNIALVDYRGMRVDEYIEEHGELTKREEKILEKYADQDCALLCAVITAAKGFIRQSAGEEVSEERVAVIQAGYSLVGKVAYFWGGKSSVLGWDDRWGSAAQVSSSGDSSTGRIRAYGLDCSGFVDWAFNNGYQDTDLEDQVGHGTSDQWNKAETIQGHEAQAGDLVFQRGPEAGSDNHVGILVGKSSSGDWIAVHCSGSQNGVTVGEAYSASFRYIRRPSVYPTIEELRARKEEKQSDLLEAANRKNTLQQAAAAQNPNESAEVE
ncbi:MAG: hydrolase [Lachnospiraceae bacterium]|nr:hydrolase [Lachnospiraceae bacterium]MCI9356532.1 hydrolase [Lachnospiraceae bacterium]